MSEQLLNNGTVTVSCATASYGDLLAWAVINRKVYWYNDANNTFSVRL